MRECQRILLVEDDAAVRIGISQALRLSGIEVEECESGEEALRQVRPGYAGILVTDVRLPGIDGLELLRRAIAMDASLPVVLITGHGDISMAVEAMRSGAYDFLEKPFSSDDITDVAQRALEKRELTFELQALRRRLSGRHNLEAKLLGNSKSMQQLRNTIENLGETDANALLIGETGTGKELVARCLHECSSRRDHNFAAINCAGIPEALFESEVFGHEPGSFTGATKRRVGKIEFAGRGTLFLDEIEGMPLALQAKLLRALQERKFERLGSNDMHAMNCRIIAATKCDLLALAARGEFRADLYYRLGVALLQIPPVRERQDDIPLLLTTFVMEAASRYGREVPNLSETQMRQLVRRPWPGNVRELRNVAEQFVLGLLHFGPGDSPLTRIAPRCLEEQLATFERHLIEETLAQCAGRISAACEILNVPRNTLYDKMRRLEILPEHFR
jgi:DNA-binding NtrC family response regulator